MRLPFLRGVGARDDRRAPREPGEHAVEHQPPQQHQVQLQPEHRGERADQYDLDEPTSSDYLLQPATLSGDSLASSDDYQDASRSFGELTSSHAVSDQDAVTCYDPYSSASLRTDLNTNHETRHDRESRVQQPDAQLRPCPGVTIRVGDYDLYETIGEGSFGKVKLGEKLTTRETFAVKIINKVDIARYELAGQVKREVAIMKMLKHRNVVSLHQVMDSDTKLYIVMDYVAGGELFERLDETGNGGEGIARHYFQQLVDGLLYCHAQGVYHRDLKPENLLLDPDGTLKISDFGFSSIKSSGTLLQTQCGTPEYCAPEVFFSRGNGYNGDKADTWSCGVILYAMLTKRLPFEASNDDDLLEQIRECQIQYPSVLSAEARNLLQRILEKDPTKRWSLQKVKQHEWFRKDYKKNAEKARLIENLPPIPIPEGDVIQNVEHEMIRCETPPRSRHSSGFRASGRLFSGRLSQFSARSSATSLFGDYYSQSHAFEKFGSLGNDGILLGASVASQGVAPVFDLELRGLRKSESSSAVTITGYARSPAPASLSLCEAAFQAFGIRVTREEMLSKLRSTHGDDFLLDNGLDSASEESCSQESASQRIEEGAKVQSNRSVVLPDTDSEGSRPPATGFKELVTLSSSQRKSRAAVDGPRAFSDLTESMRFQAGQSQVYRRHSEDLSTPSSSTGIRTADAVAALGVRRDYTVSGVGQAGLARLRVGVPPKPLWRNLRTRSGTKTAEPRTHFKSSLGPGAVVNVLGRIMTRMGGSVTVKRDTMRKMKIDMPVGHHSLLLVVNVEGPDSWDFRGRTQVLFRRSKSDKGRVSDLAFEKIYHYIHEQFEADVNRRLRRPPTTM